MLKTTENGIKPKQDENSQFIYLYASHNITISAGETVNVMLGTCIDTPLVKLKVCDDYPRGYSEYDHKLYDEFCNSHYLQLSLSKELQDKGLIQPSVEIVGFNFVDELKIKVHNPTRVHKKIIHEDGKGETTHKCSVDVIQEMKIKKGDKVARVILLEHKTYLMN